MEKAFTAVRLAHVFSDLLGNNQITTQTYTNEDQILSTTSANDTANDNDMLEKDNINIRAAYGRKFIIEKLYTNPINFLKVFKHDLYAQNLNSHINVVVVVVFFY